MAGLIGLLAGGAVGTLMKHEQAKNQAEYQQRQNAAQLLLQAAGTNPGILDLPESKKLMTQIAGPDGYAIAQKTAQLHATAQTQFNQVADGSPPPPQGGGSPSAAGQLMGAAVPQGGPAPQAQAPAGQGPQGAAPQQQVQDPETPQAIDEHIAKIGAFARNNPQFAAQAKEAIQELRDKRDSMFKEQEFAETRKDREQAHADTEADRESARTDRMQVHADSMSMSASLREQALQQQKSDEDFKNQLAKSNQDLTKARDEEARNQHLQAAAGKIDSQRDKILDDFGKATTFEARSAAEPRVKTFNDSALNFYAAHPDSTPPTLLNFTAGKKGTLGIGGADPTVDTLEPQYKDNKGQKGWSYDLGNGKSKFIPDPTIKTKKANGS